MAYEDLYAIDARDLEHTKQLAKDGFTFIGADVDEGFLVQGVKNILDVLKYENNGDLSLFLHVA